MTIDATSTVEQYLEALFKVGSLLTKDKYQMAFYDEFGKYKLEDNTECKYTPEIKEDDTVLNIVKIDDSGKPSLVFKEKITKYQMKLIQKIMDVHFGTPDSATPISAAILKKEDQDSLLALVNTPDLLLGGGNVKKNKRNKSNKKVKKQRKNKSSRKL